MKFFAIPCKPFVTNLEMASQDKIEGLGFTEELGTFGVISGQYKYVDTFLRYNKKYMEGFYRISTYSNGVWKFVKAIEVKCSAVEYMSEVGKVY